MHFDFLFHPRKSFPHAVSIVLDTPTATFAVGDVITGRLQVQAGDGPPPKSVAVELQVAGHGEVSSVGVAAECPIQVEPWLRGHRYSYSFTLTVPQLPPPYAGALFRAEHRVAAVLEMPGESVPIRGEAMKVVARAYPPAAHPVAIALTGPLVVQRRSDSVPRREIRLASATGPLIGLGVLLVGLFACGAGSVVTFVFDGSVAAYATTLLVGCTFAFLGAMLLKMTFGNWRARTHLGEPKLSLEPRHDGQRAFFCIQVDTRPEAPITGVRVQIKVHENLSTPELAGENTGFGRDRDIGVKSFALSALGPGKWAIDIPTTELEGFPPSLGLDGTHIYWQLDLVIALSRGGSWKAWSLLETFRGQPWAPVTTFSVR